jgi:squalene-associated FAD-dependent desaturase
MSKQSGPKRVHVVGAGMAGLACAIRLASSGIPVSLYESASHAGGRCRSYDDATLGCRIDNGNHLLIAGNRSAMNYLETIGARATLTGPAAPAYPFLDRATGERWVLRLNRGRLPWWIASPARRVPGTTLMDYLRSSNLFRAGPDATVDDVLFKDDVIYRRLWRPLAIAALNTPLDQASAALLASVLAESFGAGGAACLPLVPREGLSESLVDPALGFLKSRGAEIRFNARLRAIGFKGARAAVLDFDSGETALAPGEAIALAVTAPVAARLLPEVSAPDSYHAIVNAHYRIRAPENSPFFVGVIGGTAEWVFRKREVLSVTVSAADRLLDTPTEKLAEILWRDVAAAYELGSGPVPPVQIVKERRATFAATPAQLALRPGSVTRWDNLVLAGDWTDTGLPATIEGAIRSGFSAADILVKAGAGAEQKTLSGESRRSNLSPLARSSEIRPSS